MQCIWISLRIVHDYEKVQNFVMRQKFQKGHILKWEEFIVYRCWFFWINIWSWKNSTEKLNEKILKLDNLKKIHLEKNELVRLEKVEELEHMKAEIVE